MQLPHTPLMIIDGRTRDEAEGGAGVDTTKEEAAEAEDNG